MTTVIPTQVGNRKILLMHRQRSGLRLTGVTKQPFVDFNDPNGVMVNALV